MPSAVRFACFATGLGECASAWSDPGFTGVWLPETRAGGLKQKIESRVPMPIESTPTDEVTQVIAAIRRLLAGEPEDLRAVRLDWNAIPDLARRVYELAREVAPGRVLTYGWIAQQLGDADARGVGRSLGARQVAGSLRRRRCYQPVSGGVASGNPSPAGSLIDVSGRS